MKAYAESATKDEVEWDLGVERKRMDNSQELNEIVREE